MTTKMCSDCGLIYEWPVATVRPHTATLCLMRLKVRLIRQEREVSDTRKSISHIVLQGAA